MAMVASYESAIDLAASLEKSEFKDSILGSLERKDYTMALVVCGEAILQTLRRETDLSIQELKTRMQNCSKLEKLERTVSVLAREVRAQAKEKKAALRSARQPASWPSALADDHRTLLRTPDNL